MVSTSMATIPTSMVVETITIIVDGFVGMKVGGIVGIGGIVLGVDGVVSIGGASELSLIGFVGPLR